MANEKLTEWLDNQESYGVFSLPMDAQTAVDFLRGICWVKKWYTINLNKQQANTEIVHEILYKHSRSYKKELERWKKNKG